VSNVTDMYKYFVRTPDDQVERYLKMLTFLPLEEIAKIMEKQRSDPPSRIAHHTLAQEFVEITHGRDTAQKTALQHQQLFRSRSSTAQPTPPPTTGPRMPETYAHKPEAKFLNRAAGNIHAPPVTYESMSTGTVLLPRPLVLEQTLNKVLYNAGLVSSYSEGHRLIANKGAHIGSRAGDSGAMNDALSFTPIHPWVKERTPDFLIDEKLLIFKVGKWRMKMVELIDEAEFEAKGLTAPGWEEFKKRRAEGKSEYEDMPQTDFKIRKIDHTRRKGDKE
jgi:tyrosyl-tRNA synthetase